ncbi:uncharacterized protein EHS24_001475 [Apiotrichum porosum]|uniref:2Fe-2S ferredoxin-type domain-containing protein n=1 Tax=Apiotrichum porosum TaxID=105984 RepID=A0A427XKR7_9TREE|nr:uncharacterized protein EHS24_001475 [Apiotrichum porosum]RSH79428.1 hypothetical protein EHS24_001475 [Apiotrichum porosum]
MRTSLFRSALARAVPPVPARRVPASPLVLARPRVLAAARAPVRMFSASAPARHDEIVRPAPGTGIKVTYEDSNGKVIKTIEGNEGDNLLLLAHEHDIDLEGACECSVACSTCHVVVEPKFFDKLPEADDEENDMLDLAFGLEDTSRLGCQVKLAPEIDGIRVKIPSATRNMYVDGSKARTH